MMYKPLNRRRKRRLKGREKNLIGKSFCYVVYNYNHDVLSCLCGCGNIYVDGVLTAGPYVPKDVNRPFSSYAEAIAHLTRIKLAIDEEDNEWIKYTPCKIVEGCYTKSGEEHITKEVKLNNECARTPEQHISSGLSRQQRGISFPIHKTLGTDPYIQHRYYNPEPYPVRSGGTTTICSSTTAVDIARMRVQELSDQYRRYSATTN